MAIIDDAYAGKISSCKVIDAHTHIGPYYLSGWHQKYDAIDLKNIVEYNDKIGINCMVTIPHQLVCGLMSEANEIARQAILDFPNKIYAYIAVVPSCGISEIKAELDKYAKNPGFMGLKFLPGYYHGSLDGKEYQYAMDFANEVSCPVLCHIWGTLPKHSEIESAVKKRPNMNFIIAHQGGGSKRSTDLAVPIVRDYQNAYMELCGSMDNQYGVENIVDLVGEDKVIFGTDQSNLEPKYELGKVAFSPLSDEVKKKVLAENYINIINKSQMGKIKF